MDVFGVHRQLIKDYRAFTEGGTVIRDERIEAFVEDDLDAKSQWPDPWLSLNPFFASGGAVPELVDEGVLHPECARIFRPRKTADSHACDGRPLTLHQHQREAIEVARTGASLRADHRHRLGQVAGLHRADRRPRAARAAAGTGAQGSRRSSSTR